LGHPGDGLSSVEIGQVFDQVLFEFGLVDLEILFLIVLTHFDKDFDTILEKLTILFFTISFLGHTVQQSVTSQTNELIKDVLFEDLEALLFEGKTIGVLGVEFVLWRRKRTEEEGKQEG
jgi:hypothetical protein